MCVENKLLMNDENSESVYPIERYINRIGFDGELSVNLETLKRLHRKHVASIPFENLDVLLGKVISFDDDHLIEKILKNGRGGYCFEQNHLFARVLEHVGFKVTPMISRVRWQVAPEVATPLSHMVLKVECDEGAYLSDVGFGGLGLIEPIEITLERVQHERFEPRRLVERGNLLVHQVFLKDMWQDVYLFEDQRAPEIDLIVGNWFSCTHPDARFKRGIVISMANEEKRITLNNATLMTRVHGEAPVTQEIKSYPELLDVLKVEFGLSFPPDTRFECPDLELKG